MASLQEVARRVRASITPVARGLNGAAKVVPGTRATAGQALRDFGGRPAVKLLLKRITEPAGPPVTVRLMPELFARRFT